MAHPGRLFAELGFPLTSMLPHILARAVDATDFRPSRFLSESRSSANFEIYNLPGPQERTTKADQIAGTELARGRKPRGASHRPDPMMSTSLSLFSSQAPTVGTASSGAALAGANDREAPLTHSVTPNGSERLCCITLMNSRHHRDHRNWLHHSVHVDRCSHELDES
jgi:hypothetical protein